MLYYLLLVNSDIRVGHLSCSPYTPVGAKNSNMWQLFDGQPSLFICMIKLPLMYLTKLKFGLNSLIIICFVVIFVACLPKQSSKFEASSLTKTKNWSCCNTFYFTGFLLDHGRSDQVPLMTYKPVNGLASLYCTAILYITLVWPCQNIVCPHGCRALFLSCPPTMK